MKKIKPKKTLKNGKKSKRDLIYRCTKCGNLQAMIAGEVASPCEICSEKGLAHEWQETKMEILIVTKNIKKEIDKKKTIADKVSNFITDFCGSMIFIYLHLIWFTSWLLYNLFSLKPFDPYPFGLLTLIVSLEAILLATFILISQNKQGEIIDLRAELDYQTDIKAEKNTAEVLALITKIYGMLKRNGKK